VLQCSDGLRNKVSNINIIHIDNMKFLIIYYLESIFIDIYICFYCCLIL